MNLKFRKIIDQAAKKIGKKFINHRFRPVRDAVLSILPQQSRIRKSYISSTFHQDPSAAIIAYREFNAGTPDIAENYDKFLIERSVEFDYVGWARKIGEYVKDKSILDVGCGTGLHGIGYIIVGAKSYTGLDPKIKLDDDWGKNSRTKEYEHFGATPRQIMKRMPRIRLVSGTFEDIAPKETFDLIVLHNVTEHLLNIETVFEGIHERLHPEGRLLYHHHNFYCWNGHHLPPRTVDKIDMSDPAQLELMDWKHLTFKPPEKHYINWGLNKISLDDLKMLTERFFDIDTWQEILPKQSEGAGRLTAEILEHHSEFTERELDVKNVLCVARHIGTAAVKIQPKAKSSSRERDMRRDEAFMAFFERCQPYTMTSMERMYGVYREVEYIQRHQIEGAVVECGVWRGGCMMMAALSMMNFGDAERELYLFDTFEGMPQPTDEDYKFGETSARAKWDKLQSSDGSDWNYASIEEVHEAMLSTEYPANKIHLIKGMVENTLPEQAPDRISMLRLDTDFYQSTRHELEHLYPRLAQKGVLIIDDFGTWAGSFKATQEYFEKNSIIMMLNRLDCGGRSGIKTELAFWQA